MSDYAVGKGRPPRNRQFKPGQSGNPGGRPRQKGAIDVRAILDEPMTAIQEGRARTVSPREAVLRKMVRKALKDDDLRAIRYLIAQFDRHGVLEAPPSGIGGGVLLLPNSMPRTMALDLAENVGPPPWNEKQKAWARARYLANRSDEERHYDEARGYPDL